MSRNDDTEITLGTGKMLALFFGLVMLCAVFFGMGFSMGKNSVKSSPELLQSPSSSNAARRFASPGKATGNPASGADAKPDRPQQVQSSSDSTPSSPAGKPSSSPDQPTVQTPSQTGASYFVQVAAVGKQEDAEALVESLKGRQYAAFIVNPSPDKLFHVQVGPFSDVKEAEGMRSKLMSDGFNPILKK